MTDRHMHSHLNHKIIDNTSVFDEGTLFKVYKALRAAEIPEQQAIDAVNQMQNEGILFREKPVPGPQPRGSNGH